jgi:hypothetical protein
MKMVGNFQYRRSEVVSPGAAAAALLGDSG